MSKGPIISLRVAGTDCQYCEDGIEHIHEQQATRSDLIAGIARLQEDLLAALLKSDEWKRRAAQHGCNVDDGDPECG